MIKTGLIVFLMLCISPVVGQNWHYGSIIKSSLKDPNAKINFFKKDDSTFRLLVENENMFQQADFDDSLKLIQSHKGKIQIALGNEPIYKQANGDGWLIIASEHNSINSRNIVHYQETNGKLQKVQVLMELQNKVVKDDDLRFLKTNTGLVIWFESHKTIHELDEEITLIDLNYTNAFNIKKIKLQQPGGLLSFSECRLLTDSTLAFLGQQFSIAPIKKRGGKPNYQTCLLVFNKRTNTYEYNALTPKTTFVSNLKAIFQQEEMLCTFLSSSIGDQFADSIQIYRIHLNPFYVISKSSLGLSSLNLPKNNHTYNKIKQGYTNIWIDYLIPSQDFNTIVLEFFDSRTLNGGGSNAYRKYYFGPLVILNFDRNGTFISNTSIPKIQVSENDRAVFSSYRLIKDSTQLTFYYNELKSPEKERNILGMRRPINTKSVVVKASVGLDGRLEKEIILDNQINNELPLLSKAIIHKGDLIILFRSKRYFRLGSLRNESN